MKSHPLFFLIMSLSIYSYIGSTSVKAEKIKLENITSQVREKYNDKTQHIKAETSRDRKLEAAIRRELGKFDSVVRYSYNRVDLNGDKKPEVLVALSGSPVNRLKSFEKNKIPDFLKKSGICIFDFGLL